MQVCSLITIGANPPLPLACALSTSGASRWCRASADCSKWLLLLAAQLASSLVAVRAAIGCGKGGYEEREWLYVLVAAKRAQFKSLIGGSISLTHFTGLPLAGRLALRSIELASSLASVCLQAAASSRDADLDLDLDLDLVAPSSSPLLGIN